MIGSVTSTRRVLEGLLRNGAAVVGVFGLSPKVSANVSGHTRLDGICRTQGIPYWDFERVNESCSVSKVSSLAPDLIFAVGLSQLLGPELLRIPRLGCVGFHPTRLPRGRGRAPLAWLILNREHGAATFFVMEEGADSGPILVQEPFLVADTDYAGDVAAKVDSAIDRALDSWLPRLLAGEWEPTPQDETQGTYWGKRIPGDGCIDWHMPAVDIERLVRATSRPYPGAFTYVDGHKLIVWRARIETEYPVQGVVGAVVGVSERGEPLVQTSQGPLRLTEIEFSPPVSEPFRRLRVGARLGFVTECELENLRKRVSALEDQFAALMKSKR